MADEKCGVPMMGIIDFHAHILPGVDDGARDWEETRAMLSMAYEQGIRTVIATPHYSIHQDPDQIRQLVRQADQEAHRIASGFSVYPGQEILYSDSITERLKDGHALTMADSRCVLVEFMPGDGYNRIYQGIRRILLAGYHPILAHVERYPALRENGRMEELNEAGCRFQMNYKSLEGRVFDQDVRWCRRQIREERVHFLGTDAHRRDHRRPVIKKSLEWLEKNTGQDLLAEMTRGNALEILERGI